MYRSSKLKALGPRHFTWQKQSKAHCLILKERTCTIDLSYKHIILKVIYYTSNFFLTCHAILNYHEKMPRLQLFLLLTN